MTAKYYVEKTANLYPDSKKSYVVLLGDENGWLDEKEYGFFDSKKDAIRHANSLNYPEMKHDILGADAKQYNYPQNCHPIFSLSAAARYLMLRLIGEIELTENCPYAGVFSISTGKRELFCLYESEIAAYHSPQALRRAAQENGIPITNNEKTWSEKSGLAPSAAKNIEEEIEKSVRVAAANKIFRIKSIWEHPRGILYRKYEYINGANAETPVYKYGRQYVIKLPPSTTQTNKLVKIQRVQ